MEPSEAFKHIKVLTKVALESDNVVLIHEQLKMINVIIEKTTNPATFQTQVRSQPRPSRPRGG
ncbi:hypothetical protein ASC80_01690 [Afipia sp. Root123D2]|uniref:hypothetical protein n=1 Tax=Afipia sp. Root123D2 TaxID=1736436 RepID=UPI0006FF879D|nr:hypothetical protein [Afipia sp. Root123D2]KQW22135.1 hypothetical protein ASC80_01690 [Afipia sp. Root123D2]